MLKDLYKMTGLDGEYQVWYTTLNRGLKRSRSFNDLKEAKKWCKKNKGKIIINSGSWQVLEIFGKDE